MGQRSKPISLVAERAVRFLRAAGRPVTSRRLAREVLAIRGSNEATARKLLETSIGDDPRLCYASGRWAAVDLETASDKPAPEIDRALIVVQGRTTPGEPYHLDGISVLRLRGDEVQAACGGDTVEGPYGNRLRRAVLEILDGAVPVLHDPPGAARALETWLDQPLIAPVSLRRLGCERVGLAARHTLEDLVARLGLDWRETSDPLEHADTLDACLEALKRPDESVHDMRTVPGGRTPIDWSRYAFNRQFLRKIPRTAGTYRFYDKQGRLIYIGKSNNLNRRVGSYFREESRARSKRVQQLIDAVHRIEYEAVGSDLEAMLREAEMIRRDNPARNVQRQHHARKGRTARLESILILEPAASPAVLRAFLIRQGRLIGRVSIGPRGGGLARIRRILDDWFFSAPSGPTPLQGPDLDVEIVVRWLAAHRESVVAFDPTDLRTSEEVVDRLRWFLDRGSPFDPDGAPIHSR